VMASLYPPTVDQRGKISKRGRLLRMGRTAVAGELLGC
jgi:hypothetical protein